MQAARLVKGDRDRLLQEEGQLGRRYFEGHIRVQIAAGADHDAVQFVGCGQQLVGGGVEARIGEEGIVVGLDAVAAWVGHGRHPVGDAEDSQLLAHVGDAAAISDDAYA